jgi:glycosyltransferase involved in cell wall biosynthesis
MERDERNPIKIFTWHIHGSYLYYLSQGNFEIYLPVDKQRSEGYIGYGTTFPFGKNVHEVPLDAVSHLSIDCIVFQSPKNYFHDQYATLTESQRSVPKVYLEHDPPQGHPTNTRHCVEDASVAIVHVTHFNNMMWDNNGCPTHVIAHGIHIPSVSYKGDVSRGVVVINNLSERGRRLGVDIFLEARKHVPLDLIGMNTQDVGGLGEVLHPRLPAFISRYRFFFNPIRYTSLGLAVLESMMVGLPVVGMATTELVTIIQNDVSGFIHTDLNYLISKMNMLLNDRELAERVGSAGKKIAIDQFNINRFTSDWETLLRTIITDINVDRPRAHKHYNLQSDYEKENSIYK